MAIGIIYLISFILDPVVLAFKFKPIETESLHRFSELVTYFIVLDIIIVFFTGVPKDETEVQEDRQKKRNKSGKNKKNKGHIRL